MKVSRGSSTPLNNNTPARKSSGVQKADFNLNLEAIESKKSSSSPEVHQSARQKVFEDIVQRSLENPNSPLFTLLSDSQRREMASAITDQLVGSHYLSSVK